MNRLIKTGIAALSMAAVSPVFAQDVEETGVVGWTPLAIGIATPVQLPCWQSASPRQFSCRGA